MNAASKTTFKTSGMVVPSKLTEPTSYNSFSGKVSCNKAMYQIKLYVTDSNGKTNTSRTLIPNRTSYDILPNDCTIFKGLKGGTHYFKIKAKVKSTWYSVYSKKFTVYHNYGKASYKYSNKRNYKKIYSKWKYIPNSFAINWPQSGKSNFTFVYGQDHRMTTKWEYSAGVTIPIDVVNLNLGVKYTTSQSSGSFQGSSISIPYHCEATLYERHVWDQYTATLTKTKKCKHCGYVSKSSTTETLKFPLKSAWGRDICWAKKKAKSNKGDFNNTYTTLPKEW